MKNILFIFITLICFNLFAQENNVTVQWGPSHKLTSTEHYASMYGANSSGFYLVRWNKLNDNILEKYDTSLKLVFREKIIMPKLGKQTVSFKGNFIYNQQHLLLASVDDIKERKSYAIVYPFDEIGKLGDKFKIIDERPNDGKKTVNFDIALSNDTSKLLVYYNKPFHKYKNEAFSIKVLDKSLNKLWEKDITLPYKDGYFEISDYKVDNNGNVYLLALQYPDNTLGERNSKTEQSVKSIILGCNYLTGVINQYEIKLPDKWIESITYGFNESGTEVVVGGFYADNNRMTIKGVFYMTIDIETSKVMKSSIKEFDIDFMKDMIGEKKTATGAGLKHIKFDYFLTKKNGGVYLVGEHYQSNKQNIEGRFIYNDIFVTSVSVDGKIEWIKKIAKKSSDKKFGYYLSYALNFDKNEDLLNFIFNDNQKNINLFKKEPNKLIPLGEITYSVASLVTINKEGEMTRTALFKNKDLGNVILQPRLFLTDKNNIYIHGIKGRDYRFGKITFK